MVRETLEWILESLERDKAFGELQVMVQYDTFSEFMGYLHVELRKIPYLTVIYIYEYMGSSFDGDYLSLYRIYILTTSDYIPYINTENLSQEDKELLLNFVKSICNE